MKSARCKGFECETQQKYGPIRHTHTTRSEHCTAGTSPEGRKTARPCSYKISGASRSLLEAPVKSLLCLCLIFEFGHIQTADSAKSYTNRH